MRIASVDIQGFDLEEFTPKELTIRVGKQINHFLLKPSQSYQSLTSKQRSTVNYVENHIHGLKFSNGYIDFHNLDAILRDHLSDVDVIYVRGSQKSNFLIQKFTYWSSNVPNVVNLEDYDGTSWNPPKLTNNVPPSCMNHKLGLNYNCTINNVEIINKWLLSLFPQ